MVVYMAEDFARAKVERTVMLTDAVVAIAMTLLVLPLVEVAGEAAAVGIGSFVADNLALFISFGVSFLVIFLFWTAHRSVYLGLEQQGTALGLLNLVWLLGIVFLPFPTAIVGHDASTSSTPLYLGTMLVLAVVTAAMTQLSSRRARDEGHRREMGKRAVVWWVSAGVFALCTLISFVNPDLGLYGLLILVVVRGMGINWIEADAVS